MGEPSQHSEFVVGVVSRGEGDEFGHIGLLRATVETLPYLAELTSGGREGGREGERREGGREGGREGERREGGTK